MPHEHLGLFDTPPSQREVQYALAVVATLVLAFLLVLPVSDIPVGEVVAFTPVVDAVVCAGELIIATMLYAQAAIFGSRALTMLASGFVFIALLLIPHALTFPGAFAPAGLLGPGISSTAWVMIFRRLGFPITVILYVLLRKDDSPGSWEERRRPDNVLVWSSAAVGLAVAAAVLGIKGGHLLPPIFANRMEPNYFNLTVYVISNIALVVIAAAMLFAKRKSVLDMWLLVALAGWLIQSLLNVAVHARFTIGFYCLFLVILVSHLFVLLALIAESNSLYARLALSTAVRKRERDTRMMSLEAVASAISHEVGQPLAAVALSARSSLNWLTRTPPNIDMAVEALQDTIDAGRRSFDVMKSVRATFASEAGALAEFSLGELVNETVSLLAKAFAGRNISVQLDLDDALPPIAANRVQIQRVLVNLLTNATEAIGARGSRPRRITIHSSAHDEPYVLLEISDTGAGIAPEQIEQIFDPFFTTRSTGTGLGLTLSRTIVEEHGGRLWASQDEETGTTFHMTLPKCAVFALPS